MLERLIAPLAAWSFALRWRLAFALSIAFASGFAVVPGFPAAPAFAGEAQPTSADPQLEKRVNTLSETLRCLVCQNQTIADSHAELAVDLKNQIREKLKKGETEDQILDYMVARYGDFVLYNPPFKLTTLALWIGPLALLALGLWVLFRNLARRKKEVSEVPLSDADRERARALLNEAREEAK